MVFSTANAIVAKVLQITHNDGVSCMVRVIREDIPHPKAANVWDVELKCKNYIRVERFHSYLGIYEEDVDNVAIDLIRSLFTDYFEAKLRALK